jgi:ATP-binding cassette subfamily B protein
MLHLNSVEIERLIRQTSADPTWLGLASLDASARMLSALRVQGALDRATVRVAIEELTATAQADASTIPDQYWSVALATPATDGADRVRLRGAVLVRALARTTANAQAGTRVSEPGARQSSPELVAALKEPPTRPLSQVLRALRSDGLLAPVIVLSAIAIAAVGVVLEAVLLRSVLDVSALLNRPEQGVLAGVALALFALALCGLEIALASAERRAGNHLETRLRVKFFEKIPRLADSYFQSRPISDMLERSHSVHVLRMLPQLGVRTLRVGAEIIVTATAIIWLDPAAAWLAIAGALAAAAIPLMGNAFMAEYDMKVRTHAGALTRFHLDALLGRTAIEAHGAEATIEREHDRLLAEWVRASRALQRRSTIVEGMQMLVGFGVAAWILFGHLAGGEGNGTVLLLTYWVLNLPALGYELALTAREYPSHRSTVLRLLEPLGAPETQNADANTTAGSAPRLVDRRDSVRIAARAMCVKVAGHTILDRIDLEIPSGSHVAIVGASGAGKSTLVGTLLGWHRPASGELFVDDEPLVGGAVDDLRRDTAWVDPSVRIWNRSLFENLTYGSEHAPAMTSILETSGLLPVVGKLPEGLATPLGEGGTLLSAGEGQRVRLGRALARQNARLVLLDEPFLGLERDRRRVLLSRARQHWAGRTMVYVTHDVAETRSFDRVVVLERGRVVEEGEPLVLAQMPSSRFRRLLQTQEMVSARLTSGGDWRRIRLEAGRIVQEHGTAFEQRA